MGKKLGGADPAAVAAVVVVNRRGRAGARRGKPARAKRAIVAAPVAAPAPAPARVTVSGTGRPRVLPASTVGTCGLTALAGTHDGRAARESAAAPRVHEVPVPVAGEAARVVDGALCIVDRATGAILAGPVYLPGLAGFVGPVYLPALAGKGCKRCKARKGRK